MSGEVLENTMRRWSMPWDCKNITDWPRQDVRSRLRIPHQNRSRSTTPDTIWKASTMASQDGLQEAIQLLSCKPGVYKRKKTLSVITIYYNLELFYIYIGIRPLNQLIAYTNQHIPGVTLTTCNFESNYDSVMWPASRKIGFPRYWPRGSHSSDHSDQSGHRESDQSAHSGEHRDSGRDLMYIKIYSSLLIAINYLLYAVQNKVELVVVTEIAKIAFIRTVIIEKSNLVSIHVKCNE